MNTPVKTTRIKIPRSIADVDDAWLTGALRRAGRIGATDTAVVVDIKPLSGGTAFSTVMYRMQLKAPGLPSSAILKLSLNGPARPIIDGTGAYLREVSFYRDLSVDVPVRCPKAYVAEYDDESKDMVLLIEDLAPLVPVDQLAGLTMAQAESAMDGLARFHAWSWNHPRLAQFEDRIPSLDSDRGRAVLTQCAQFVAMSWPSACRLSGENMSEEVRAFGARYASLVPFFVEKLTRPKTIVHGEFRGENLFFDSDGTLILIDFQLASQAAGISDVSYLLSQSLPIDIRRGNDERLVRRYWDGLVAGGVKDYPWDKAWEQYRISVAYNLYLPGIAFMTYEATDDRGKALLLQMLSRASAAIMDNRSLEFLPKESQ